MNVVVCQYRGIKVSYVRPSTLAGLSRRNQITPSTPHQYSFRSASFVVSRIGNDPLKPSPAGSNASANALSHRPSAPAITAATSATHASKCSPASAESPASTCTYESRPCPPQSSTTVASSIDPSATAGTSRPWRLTADPDSPVPTTRPSTAVSVFGSDGGSGLNHPLPDRVAVLASANPSRTERPGVPDTSSCTTTAGRPGAHAVVVRRCSP